MIQMMAVLLCPKDRGGFRGCRAIRAKKRQTPQQERRYSATVVVRSRQNCPGRLIGTHRYRRTLLKPIMKSAHTGESFSCIPLLHPSNLTGCRRSIYSYYIAFIDYINQQFGIGKCALFFGPMAYPSGCYM